MFGEREDENVEDKNNLLVAKISDFNKIGKIKLNKPFRKKIWLSKPEINEKIIQSIFKEYDLAQHLYNDQLERRNKEFFESRHPSCRRETQIYNPQTFRPINESYYDNQELVYHNFYEMQDLDLEKLMRIEKGLEVNGRKNALSTKNFHRVIDTVSQLPNSFFIDQFNNFIFVKKSNH